MSFYLDWEGGEKAMRKRHKKNERAINPIMIRVIARSPFPILDRRNRQKEKTG